MNARKKLAMNLRRLRVERGLSQERLAADAGVDRAYCGGLERMAENPTIDLLDKLARAMDVDVAELLARPTTKKMPPNLTAGRKATAKLLRQIGARRLPGRRISDD